MLGAGCVAALVTATPALAKSAEPKPVLDGSAAAVPDQYSASTAQQIFAQGGNAVDAAVAIAFTLAVTDPDAGGLGGGGFMTLYVGGKPYFLDYLERAPQRSTRDMYLDDKGQPVAGMSTVGFRAVAVPGTVDGLWEAQRRFGKLKWKQVLAPAIHYATDGFKVDSRLAKSRADAAPAFAGKTDFDAYFANLKAGVNFQQPELAQTLSRIASDGGREFYEGQTADLVVKQMLGHGLLGKQDLQQYKAVWREPLYADWNGYRIVTAPPPSSGGVGLIQMLKMKADLKQSFDGLALNSAPYIHLIAQIEDRVFADREQYMDDPDATPVPVDKLLDDAYLAPRADEVSRRRSARRGARETGLAGATLEKPQTTHFSVVDKWGNAVSNTYTLNGSFGSGVVVDGGGFLLNDQMDDFVTRPAGVPASAASPVTASAPSAASASIPASASDPTAGSGTETAVTERPATVADGLEHDRGWPSTPIVDDANHSFEGWQGGARHRHTGRLADLHDDFPGDDGYLRLRHVAGRCSGRDALPSSIAAAKDHLLGAVSSPCWRTG